MKSWFIRNLLSLMLLASLCTPVAASAPADPICVWTGSMSDDYSTALNWTCNATPGLQHDVYIGSAPREPRLTGTGSAKSLTLNPGGMLTLNPDAHLTIAAGFTHNQGAELFPGANSTVTLLNGDWANNGGAIVGSYPWTAAFGGQGNQAITGARPEKTFHHVTLNNASMTLPEVQFGGSTTSVVVNGTLTLNQDTALNTGPTGSLTLKGNLVNNGGSLGGSGLLSFAGGSDQLLGGSRQAHFFSTPVTINKSGGRLSLDSNLTAVSFDNSLVVSGGTLRLGGKNLTTNGATTMGPGTLDLGGGPWTAQGTVTLGPGAIFTPGAGATVVIENGDWTNNGGTVTDATPSWSLTFYGPGDQWINGTAATQNFGNVALANPTMALPAVQVGGGVTRVNLQSLTLGPDTTFRPGTATTVRVNGNWVSHGGQFEGGPQHEVYFGGGDDQVIGGTAPSQTFSGRVRVDKSAGAVTLGGSTQQVTINGPFSVYGGSLSLGSGTLTTKGITEVAKGGTFNLGSGTWNAYAAAYFATGGAFNAGLGTLNFRGNYIAFYGGTVNPGASTTNFQMVGSQRISGQGTANFHHVNIHNLTMAPAGFTIGGTSSGPSGLNATGNFYIGDDVIFNPGTATNISIGGDFGNDGVFVPGASTVTFNGGAPLSGHRPDAAQTIGGAQRTTFNNLTIDNPAGVTLAASQTVSGVLNLKAGDLTTAAYTLTLGSAATVTGTHEVVGAVQRTQAFTIGVPYSFGQPNLTITFAQVGGVTGMAVNAQKSAPDRLRPAVPRTVSITPVGAGYNATLRLPYQDAELGGIAEADLRLWRRGETRWETGGAQVANAAENWVEQSGITAFSTWALAPASASQGDRIYMPLIWR
jgi:hypothetical protein